MIKKSIKASSPNAKVILYGSQARGDNKAGSDIDILVLVDKEKITREDEKNIKYPLYEIEFDTGTYLDCPFH
jgi:predicted nucleotidyltransferase